MTFISVHLLSKFGRKFRKAAKVLWVLCISIDNTGFAMEVRSKEETTSMQLGIEEEVEEKEKDLLSDEEGMKLDKPDDDEDEDEDEDEDDDTSEDERESEAEIQRLEEQVT